MRLSGVAKRSRQGPAQAQPQNFLAPLGAQDRAREQHLSAQRHQAWRRVAGNVALEVGDQVEQEANQAEGGFGAVEGVQTKSVGAEVLLEFLEPILAVGAAVVKTPRPGAAPDAAGNLTSRMSMPAGLNIIRSAVLTSGGK